MDHVGGHENEIRSLLMKRKLKRKYERTHLFVSWKCRVFRIILVVLQAYTQNESGAKYNVALKYTYTLQRLFNKWQIVVRRLLNFECWKTGKNRAYFPSGKMKKRSKYSICVFPLFRMEDFIWCVFIKIIYFES